MEIYINDFKWVIESAGDCGIDFTTQTIWLNLDKSREALNQDITAMLTQAYAYSFNYQAYDEVEPLSYFLSAHFDAIYSQKRKILEVL